MVHIKLFIFLLLYKVCAFFAFICKDIETMILCKQLWMSINVSSYNLVLHCTCYFLFEFDHTCVHVLKYYGASICIHTWMCLHPS